MYGKCRCLLYARRIFNVIGLRNEVTWSAMLGAFLSCEAANGALELYGQMLLSVLGLSQLLYLEVFFVRAQNY